MPELLNDSNFEMEFVLDESPVIELIEKPIIHYKNSRRNKVNTTPWDQSKYEEKKMVWFLGKNVYEVSNNGWDFYPSRFERILDNGINADEIVVKLNQQNMFTFEYFPVENDCLIIKFEYLNIDVNKRKRPFLTNGVSFIFNGNIWIVNEKFYDHNHMFIESKKGYVTYIT